MEETQSGESEEDEEWVQQNYIYFKLQYWFVTLVLSKEQINVLF